MKSIFRRIRSVFSAKTPTSVTPVKDMVADILGRYGTTVLNVGARWGDKEAWWRLDPLATMVGFEPDPQECDRLNAMASSPRRERFLPLALGELKQDAVLYQTQEPACASLFPPLDDLADRFPQLTAIRKKGARSIALEPLDGWWESEDRPHVSFIKLDTQGSELAILRGARNLLNQCLGVEVEVEFSPLYRGQPLFSEVDTFLRELGFSLWGLRDLCHYSEQPKPDEAGRLYWANAIYFRDYRTLTPGEEDWRSNLVLAALLEAYGDRAAARSCLNQALEAISVTPSAGRPRLEWTGSPA